MKGEPWFILNFVYINRKKDKIWDVPTNTQTEFARQRKIKTLQEALHTERTINNQCRNRSHNRNTTLPYTWNSKGSSKNHSNMIWPWLIFKQKIKEEHSPKACYEIESCYCGGKAWPNTLWIQTLISLFPLVYPSGARYCHHSGNWQHLIW